MFWAQSSDALRSLCRFSFSFSCVLHSVECLSHSLMEHSPLNPVFREWFPLPHELPLEPGLRGRRQTLQYNSLFCRTFSLSSKLSFNHGRQLLAHTDRWERLRCHSLKSILRYSCKTSLPWMRLQNPHSVTGLPSVLLLYLLLSGL